MDLPFYKFFYNHCFGPTVPDPDVQLDGKTVLVTGGNQGLGFETCLHYARRNAARIIIASRDLEKCKAAAAKVYQEVPSYRGKVDCMKVDMSSFESVRSFVKDVEKEVEHLDCALLNAGLQDGEYRKTVDGYESTLQVNVISTGLLAVLLLPKLKASRKPGSKPHLTIVASEVHFWSTFPTTPRQCDADNIIETLNKPEEFQSLERYQVSKLLEVLFVRDIAALPEAEGIVVNCANPGWCQSSLSRDMPAIVNWIFRRIQWSPSYGSRSFVVATTADTKPGAFVSGGREHLTSTWSVSPKGKQVQKKLWGELTAIWRKAAPEVSSVLA